MPHKRKANKFPIIAALAVAIAGYAVFLRKRLLRWGATSEQAKAYFPGDGLISNPNYQSTRSILIRATPKDVWPWIAQIGYQRGGFYSYDWLERKAGLVGLHSADQVVPDWQKIQPGDTVSISPVTPLKVAVLQPEKALVLHTVMNPFTAQVIDPATQSGSPYIDWSWAFVLEPVGASATRLIARVRADFQPRPVGKMLSWLALEPAHFLMERKMLLGIQRRAEAHRTQPLTLDEFLPKYDFTEVHRLSVHAPAEKVYRAMKELKPSELSPLVFAMLNLRQLPAILMRRGEGLSQPLADKTFLEQLYEGGFIPLVDDAQRKEVVFGLIGQFWKLNGGEDVQVVEAEAFRTFQQTDFAKVAANLLVQEIGDEALLSTETRIWAPDEATRGKFAAYWKLISMGSGWIRVLWLKAIRHKAEHDVNL